jgi:hypothetical protein
MALQLSVGIMIGLILLGLGGFIASQRYGMLSRIVGLAERLPWRLGHKPQLSQRLRDLDTHLVTYYTHYPWRFVRSLCWHGLGFAFAGIKAYILLHLLLGSQAPDLAGAFTVAVAVDALDQLFFFVPGRLGTLEGVRFTVLSTLGITQVYGLAFGLMARLELLVWSGLGLLAYALCTRHPAVLQVSRPVKTQAPG